jgi:hypothetical protein
MRVALGLAWALCACDGEDAGGLDPVGDATPAVDAGRDASADASVGADDATTADAGRDVGPDATHGPEPLPPLPPTQSATSARFASHEQCARCHAAEAGSSALRDASGRDISMVPLWRSSMMSFAARDPVFLAAFAHELASNPAATDLVEATCTRCHAAAASVERGVEGEHATFDDLIAGTDPVSSLGRDGVTCTVCHQIRDDGLGTDDSFTGGFVIGADRELFGPHASPFATPMVRSSGFTPVASAHVRDSALCATCHTVITRALDEAGAAVGPPFPEQVPFLEWRNSDYASGGAREASCQDCHVQTVDADGTPIETRISTRPPFLDPRRPVGRHVFRGGNAYVLGLIAENLDFVGVDVEADTLAAAVQQTRRSLESAARLVLVASESTEDALRYVVRVVNETGHRFPTGYPTRRAWLRVSGLDAAGAVVWQSGRVDARGALVDAEGRRLDRLDATLPHRSVIAAEDEVQVWHAEMLDLAGARTHTLLHAAAYAVDNRILPHGWRSDHPDASWARPVGTDGDPDFEPGSDDVEIRIPRASGAVQARVELLFQSVPPAVLEGLADFPTPASARLASMMEATPPTPDLIDALEIGP